MFSFFTEHLFTEHLRWLLLIFWHCYYSFCIVFAYHYPLLTKCSFCIICFVLLYFSVDFTFIFIFSITHSGQNINTHILDIVFITRPHIFLSKNFHLKFVIEFLVLRFLIGQWSVSRWSVHLVGGRLISV